MARPKKSSTELPPEVAQALAELEKKYGEKTVFFASSEASLDVEAISTGSIGLDIATGVGGIPKGRITEIYGPESAGKTTLCLHVVAEAQRAGLLAAYIDMENALDRQYAARLGVDLDRLMVSQPDSGEQALEIVETLANTGQVGLVVVDSVAALTPTKEIEGEMGDATMAQMARLMSQAMRKLNGPLRRSNMALVFVNQLRQKIGIVYGNPEVTTGGMALKYYASLRLDVRRNSILKGDGNTITGARTRVRVVKNKCAPPYGEAEFDIMHNQGISKLGELLDIGVQFGVIEKSGAFFSYGETKLGRGRDAARELLTGKPELVAELAAAVMAAAKKSDGVPAGSGEEPPPDEE